MLCNLYFLPLYYSVVSIICNMVSDMEVWCESSVKTQSYCERMLFLCDCYEIHHFLIHGKLNIWKQMGLHCYREWTYFKISESSTVNKLNIFFILFFLSYIYTFIYLFWAGCFEIHCFPPTSDITAVKNVLIQNAKVKESSNWK